MLQGERSLTGCVDGRQVCCSFNSQGRELPSLPVCHAKGGPFGGCYTSAGAHWDKHGAGSGTGHSRKHLYLPRLYGQHGPWAPVHCCSAVLNSLWGLLLRDRMVFPGVTSTLLVTGADHSNHSAKRRNYEAESWWGAVDSCYKGTAKENFKRKL